jgi:hypothetical protein
MRRRRRIVNDIIKGAVAGALATWAMDKVTTFLYERERESARQREDAARHGRTAYEMAAAKAALLVGKGLPREKRKRFGQGIHWALGIGAGALYGALRPRDERVSLAGGLLFGAAFWLLMDEAITPALRLTKGPAAFPWQTHARGLAGHLAYGVVADKALSAVQPRA